jgi:hypothetical protein
MTYIIKKDWSLPDGSKGSTYLIGPGNTTSHKEKAATFTSKTAAKEASKNLPGSVIEVL